MLPPKQTVEAGGCTQGGIRRTRKQVGSRSGPQRHLEAPRCPELAPQARCSLPHLGQGFPPVVQVEVQAFPISYPNWEVRRTAPKGEALRFQVSSEGPGEEPVDG